MRRTTQRLVFVCVLLLAVSVVGFVLALIFQWPSDVVIGPSRPNVTAADSVRGTVTSIPLVPMIALAVCALLAPSRRWWGTLAVVMLCLLGGLFFIATFQEVVTPPPAYVPGAVRVGAIALYGLLSAFLIRLGIADLIDRARRRRQPSHA